jgi:hypothetical protein
MIRRDGTFPEILRTGMSLRNDVYRFTFFAKLLNKTSDKKGLACAWLTLHQQRAKIQYVLFRTFL